MEVCLIAFKASGLKKYLTGHSASKWPQRDVYIIREHHIHLLVGEFSLQIIEKLSKRCGGKHLLTGYREDHVVLALCQVKL